MTTFPAKLLWSLVLAMMVFWPLSSKGSDSFPLSLGKEQEVIEYRALVWADKGSVERYGGETIFRKKLNRMFAQTTEFFNESPNRFHYYFRFVPAGLRMYDTQGDRNRIDFFKKQAFGKLDTGMYDYVVFFALDAVASGTSCGGGGESGQCVVMCYRTLEEQAKNGDIFSKEPPLQGTYSDLGHEYGHMRGATDLYQYKILAEDNPVSHKDLNPPPCNMGTGFRVWSDYCSALFNYTARQKQLDRELPKKIFPEKLVIKVMKHGQLVPGASVRFYGTRAGGAHNRRDVYPDAFRTFQTAPNGMVEIMNLYELYHPAPGAPGTPPKQPVDLFPYSYWFSFLVEAVCGDTKSYAWLPDFVLQEDYLRTGKKKYELILKVE
ncbi:hypothetical protein QET93_004155 [Akkermansia sp. N21116]|uniref:hypothetical protein n=1 Tax=Akkermansia sp. N21116 TaxID=3040764 RepID=UPI002AC8AE86|nr:hypothetical protein [Akkermansia sp. N21116]WPX41295.1 hypothetical protein QET93_004155 [Akkermansia sp. N21116]